MRTSTPLLLTILAATAFGTYACGGGDPGVLSARGGGGAGGGGVENPGANAPLPTGTVIGAAGLRRLTTRQYEASVRDAFALGTEWKGAELTADRASTLGFDNDTSLLEIDDTRSAELGANAESAADAILANKKLAALPACQTVTKECAAAVATTFGARLFHRALTADESTRYAALYDTVSGQATANDGMKWMLVALLDSPSFLYRSEVGASAGGTRIALTGEEIATELAYTFRGSIPDDALLEQGRRGELFTAEARVAAARALLDTPRGHEVLEDFTRQWLRYGDVTGLAKDETVVPGFTAIRADMAEETRHFLDDLLFTKKGGLKELLTSAETFVTPALATHYGLPAGSSGAVSRPAEQAIGLLAQGSILSRYALTGSSSPPQRGAFVRRKLLCQSLPAPPPNAGTPPIPDPGLTTRELYEKVHASQPSCAGCHALIDPVGFGLESFDVAGRYRTTERNKPVNASGQIANFGAGGAPTFTDHKGLAALLAASPDVADCVGGMMAAYALGSTTASTYTTPEARAGMRDGSVKLLDFFAQLAAAPHFALRTTDAK